MKTFIVITFILISGSTVHAEDYLQDTISTEEGELLISFLGHGTLYFTYNEKVIHIDPVDNFADYAKLPKADIILVTHQHGDHFQKETLNFLKKESTQLVLTKACAASYKGESIIAKNGDILDLQHIRIEVVPAYNLVHERSKGNPYHPKGEGNGYILNFGDKRVYIGGDTENFPEMKDIKDIDIAFLPMNLPYTMTPEMVAEAVKVLRPRILYPYHYGESNIQELLDLTKEMDFCEVRIRRMK